ncbi:MAG: ROK family protein [Candidatus Eremiobacteraeota bacterium]|nr:ROK family protein [Candidatus Eremiobacteraeota bacterium]
MELIGVNVGGTTSSVVRGDESGKVVDRRTFSTRRERGSAALYAEIVATIEALRTSASRAIGVAIGGPLDAARGVVLNAPHLPFRDFPLLERLREDLAIPVAVHHDAAACALAEWHWGPDAGVAGLAYLTCGTGFGVGLVLDGRVRYGSSGHSPEIGHVRYRDHGPEIFGKPGCFEGFGSATALALLARARNAPRFATSTPAQIAALSAEGDREASEIVAENARAVGAACALLADLLVLDVIVLGSLARYLGRPWIALVRERFEGEALPANAAHCRLRAPMEDVQDLSGLAAAVQALPSPAGG